MNTVSLKHFFYVSFEYIIFFIFGAQTFYNVSIIQVNCIKRAEDLTISPVKVIFFFLNNSLNVINKNAISIYNHR